MDLVLFGIQGSGKGTQARKLVEEFGYSLFETGAELRKIAASGSDLGNTVKSFIDAGNLAPHLIVMEVVRNAILALPKEQQILFDGIPRDKNQMISFNKILAEAHRDFFCVHLTLTDDDAFERIKKRAELEGRADDASDESIRRRMQIFKENTLPVVEAYRAEGKITDVDGQGTVEEVYERMRAAVEAHQA